MKIASKPVPKHPTVNPSKVVRTEAERPQRDERIPFGSPSLDLTAVGIPGMHLHWINDWHPSTPERLQKAIQAGYQFVHQSETQTSTAHRLGNPTSDLGERVSRVVGVRPDGTPITSYLMKIKEEWHLEHQQPVWDHADKVDAAIRRGQYKRTDGDGRYTPGGPKSISVKSELGEKDG